MLETKINQRYRVLRLLSSGENARTVFAEDLQVSQVPSCVVKKYPAECFGGLPSTEVDRRFQQGVEVLSMLGTHDRIPGIRDHFTLDGDRYIAVEYVAGRSLAAEFQLRQQPFGDFDAATILHELLEILAYVHSHDAVHGDVKPANVIRRTEDGALALVGFEVPGLVTDDPTPAAEISNEESTADGWSPSIDISPPQAPPARTDLQGAALIAIQAMAGRGFNELRPDPATGELSWRGHLKIRSEFADILDRMMRPEGQGYASAGEAQSDLARLLQIPETQPPPVEGHRPYPIPPAPEAPPIPAAGGNPVPAVPYSHSPDAGDPQPPLPPMVPSRRTSPARSSNRLPIVIAVVVFVALGIGMIAIVGVVALNVFPDDYAETSSNENEKQERRAARNRSDPTAFDRGLAVKGEAEKLRLLAKTRSDWYNVADTFSHASSLFSQVGSSDPNYSRAQLELKSCMQSRIDAQAVGSRLPVESSTPQPAATGPPGANPATPSAPPKEITPPAYGNYLSVTSGTKGMLFTGQTHGFRVNAYQSGMVSISVDEFGTIEVQGPGKGELSAGHYVGASPRRQENRPYLLLSGYGGCYNRDQGNFVVKNVRYVPQKPNSPKREILELELSFDVTCPRDGRVRGQLRYVGGSESQSNLGN